jgi:hypothetical protein
VNLVVVAVNNFGDTRSGGLAGPMGLFIIVLMSIAVVMLIRNMNKRLRRLPDSFPDPEAAERDAEIARLNAQLDGSDAGPRDTSFDDDRSSPPDAAAEPEVSDVRSADRPGDGDPGQGRSR